MRKYLLAIISTLLLAAPSFAKDKKVTVSLFTDYNIGDTLKVFGSTGMELKSAYAVIDTMPGNKYNKMLHVFTTTTGCYVEVPLPEGMTGTTASANYDRVSAIINVPQGQKNCLGKKLVIYYGSKKASETAVTLTEGKGTTVTVSQTKVSAPYDKAIRIGLASATNSNYYIDNIYLVTKDYGYDYTVKEETARYWADMIGKSIGVCVNPDQLNDARVGQTIYRNFNLVVGENAMKFDATEGSRNNFNFNQGDQIVNWALKHNMAVRGHTLAWHSQTSQWVHNTEYSKEEMFAILKNHIFKVVGHWKGKIREWDVVNECLAENVGRGVGQGYQLRSADESVWYRRCGEAFIDSAFVWAHQADPDAILYLNDYNIGHWGNGHYENGKTHAIYNLAKRLKDSGIPIHGVGMQMHTSISGLQVDQIEETVKQFAAIGLKCIITELDMPGSKPSSDAEQKTQATKYAGLASIICRYDNAPSMVVWGIADNRSWLDDSEKSKPLLFTGEFEAKPSYISTRDMFRTQAERITGIEDIEDDGTFIEEPEFVDVYSLAGVKIYSNISRNEVESLPAGLYIVGGKKVLVK